MITIYPSNAEDFSTLGLGMLRPTECIVEEQERGIYQLTMRHPIDKELRWTHLETGRIVRAPAPVRETPLVQIGNTGTVARQIYRITTSTGARLRMRAKPSLSAKILRSYKPGTEVVRLEVSGSWARVILRTGGATGWMWAANLVFVRTENDTVSGDKPGSVVQPRQTREQLFVISSVSRDTADRAVSVVAEHISYDLSGNIIDGKYEPKNVSAGTVANQLMTRMLNPHDFTVYTNLTKSITGDYSYVNGMEAFLDPDQGVAVLGEARLIRDNFDFFLLKDEERDLGVTIRHRKNLKGANLEINEEAIITRIIPEGKTDKGEPLYLSGTRYIDSPNIGNYRIIHARKIEYDVQVGDGDGEFKTVALARAELKRLAEADFAAGIDLPTVGLEVDFVALENTAEYAAYADLQRIHLYDTVRVAAPYAGIDAKLRMTGYQFDAIRKRYISITLGQLESLEQTLYGYNFADGSVYGAKLVGGSLDGATKLRNLSVDYAKFNSAAIGQLTADSITATRALIKQLATEQITTDELYAALAMIAIAQITTANIKNANITWADIQSLTTAMASIANAEIGTADISWAHIKDLITGNAIFTEGVGGKLFVSRLAVTEANMVSLTTGELVVKGADGNFYAITIVDGVVTPVKKEITGDNVANNTIPGGKMIENTITARELNATAIFADNATIRDLIAANLNVDTFFARVATVNKIKTMTVASVEAGSAIIINSQVIRLEAPLVSIVIPGAEEGQEVFKADKDGVYAERLSSPTVARRVPGGVYRVGNDYDTLADAFGELEGAVLDGPVVLKLVRNDPGGTLRGVRGGHSVTITSGNLIERYAINASYATLSADGAYGYKVTADSAGTYRYVRVPIGRVGDLGLAGKTLSVGVGAITNYGGTRTGVALYIYDGDYRSNPSSRGEIGTQNTAVSYVIPSDTDDDRTLALALYVSGTTSCAQGAYVVYDRIRVELGETNTMFSLPTARYNIADFEAVGCDRVHMARVGLPTGARIRDSDFVISRSDLYGEVGVLADMARVRMNDNKGNCTKAVKAQCAQVYVTGPAPGGTYEGWLIDTTTAQISGGGSAPTEITKTLTANATGTYSTYWWSGDRAIRQGYTPSNGRLRGGMWWDFGAIPAGATITAMKLTIKRTSGFGKGDNVTLKAYGTASDARSGQPALTMGPYTLGVINNGQTKTFDLPAALVTALANGTVKGIVLYADDTSVLSGKTYSTNYARFDGTDGTAPKLAVTYEM